MKPKTKLQFRVTELSEQNFGISLKQKEWAYKKCLQHKGYASKSSAFCLDCGETFPLVLIKRKRATCPHCQTKLTIEQTRKTTDKQINYFAIATVVEDFQVIRNYELMAYYKKGKPVKYHLHAILETWILPNLKTTLIGKLHTCNSYCDSWGGSWEIRTEGYNYWNSNKYNIYPRKYHPASVFKPEYAKYGINSNLSGLNFLEAIKVLPGNPHAETLLKAKQFSLFAQCLNYNSKISKYWPSIKICLRNKYKVVDAGLWFDYLDLMRDANKDLRSPKYVCPKNLKQVHDRMVEKRRAAQRKIDKAKQLKRIKADQQEYEKQKSIFFGLQFSTGNLIVKVLEKVQEFIEEGDIHKHCLYTNRYFEKPNSLILSARVDGKPVETIEVSLSQMKIVQSRGLGNKASPFNEQIIDLLNQNMKQIKTRYKQFKKTA
jgi:hypothetical protein